MASLLTKIEDMDASAIPFAGTRLNALSDCDVDTYETVVSSVDLSRVVGTTHQDYAGKTWGDLKPVPGTLTANIFDGDILSQPLKRATLNCKELKRNPEYYLSNECKMHWSFYELEHDYYISSGNHRTIIARYFFYLNQLPAVVHGVKVMRATLLATPQPQQPASCNLVAQLFHWLRGT